MSFLLLIAALVALAWMPILLARSSLAWGCVAFLVLANCCGLEFLTIDVGPLNMSLERFFLLGLPVAYLLQRRLGRADPKPLAASEWLLFALTALLAVSTFTHDHHAASAFAAPVVQHLINGYLIPLAIFWIARQMKITQREIRGAYAGLVAFGVYLTFTGICEGLGAWGLVFPKHIANPDVGIHFGRARGPMVNSVTYGVALAASIFCGWLLWGGASRRVKLLLLALLPAALAALFFSKTRSVWLGSALGAGVLMFTCLRGTWRPLALGAAAAAGLVLVATNFDRLMAFDRKDNTAAQTRESVEARGSFFYVSWQMFKDRPLLGFGFGQFPLAKLPYLGDRETDLQLETIRPWVHHNTYLSLLTEVGIAGLGLFVALLVAWGRQGWQLWRDATAPSWVRGQGALMLAVLVLYAVQAAFHEMSFSARDHSLLFFFAGITSGLSAKAATVRVPATARMAVRWPWRTARA